MLCGLANISTVATNLPCHRVAYMVALVRCSKMVKSAVLNAERALELRSLFVDHSS